MNSHLLLPALLAGACLACSNDSETNRTQPVNMSPSAILFSGHITNIAESKAILEAGEMPEGAKVGISAWGHDSKNAKSDSTLRKDLNNAPYSRVGNAFAGAAEAHYPVNPDTVLNFYAYYPYQENATDLHSIPFDLSEQYDILAATPVTNRGKESADKKVDLSFNHLLSAITVKIKKAANVAEDMTVGSVKLAGYPSSVHLDAINGTITAAASTDNYEIKGGTTAVTATEATLVSDYLLYPVAAPTFLIHLNNKDFTIKSSTPFAPGKKQTYTFTVQTDGIGLSATIQPWGDGGSTNEDIIY